MLRVQRYQVEVLLDHGGSQPDDAANDIDIIEIGGEKSDRFKVTDVAFDGFFRVVGLLADRRHEVAFEIECDDLALVGLA